MLIICSHLPGTIWAIYFWAVVQFFSGRARWAGALGWSNNLLLLGVTIMLSAFFIRMNSCLVSNSRLRYWLRKLFDSHRQMEIISSFVMFFTLFCVRSLTVPSGYT